MIVVLWGHAEIKEVMTVDTMEQVQRIAHAWPEVVDDWPSDEAQQRFRALLE